jgi:riboflavin biosynthesis pyrimidine reductase
VRCLFPTAGDVSDSDLETLYAYPDRPWLRANFVSSLDGAAQGTDFRSGTLSSRADQAVFALLRRLADIVIAGAGTTRMEGYKPIRPEETAPELRRRLGLEPIPAVAVVSGSLRLDPELVRGGAAPTVVITTEAAPPAELAAIRAVAPVVIAGQETVDLGTAVDQLVALGYQRMLCEGGPTLMHGLVAAGRLDELCLTVNPRLLGGDRLRIVHGTAFDPPARLALRHLLEEDGDLFARYLVDRPDHPDHPDRPDRLDRPNRHDRRD